MCAYTRNNRFRIVLAMMRKFWGKGTPIAGEQGLVVQLVLYPSHEKVDVLWGRTFDWLLHLVPVCPVILIFWSSRHYRAAGFRAELRDGAVQHVDLVEEVYGVDRNPLVDVLPLRQHHRQPQISWTKGGCCMLHEFMLMAPLGDILLRLEGLWGPVTEKETHP